MLVRLAREGRSVVRLKGGDPFVFGRGSEEAVHLVENGIPFEVVPGVTAALACAAYSGIPLTHRGLAKSVRVITGHRRDNRALDFDWPSLADGETTLVVYMGLANLGLIARELMDAGAESDRPAAARLPRLDAGPARRARHAWNARRPGPRRRPYRPYPGHHRRGGVARRDARLVRAGALRRPSGSWLVLRTPSY